MVTQRLFLFFNIYFLLFPSLCLSKDAFLEDLSLAEDLAIDKEQVINSLDGIQINAVEKYPHLDKNEFTFGTGIFPFNAYVTGYSLEGTYTYYFGKRFAWEAISAAIVFPVKKDLTAELAENYSVNPKEIEQLERILSTNIKYVYSYGKSIFMEKHIRYYKSSFITGIGQATSNIGSDFTVNLGLDIDFVLSSTYSWKFQFMDYMSVTGKQSLYNFGAFKLLLSARF